MFSIPKQHQKTALIISGVVLLFSLLLAWYMISDSDPSPVVYYYDLNSGKLFAKTYVPDLPIPAPSGPTPDGKPAGVRAIVFSCGQCADESKRVIGFLETRPTGERGSPSVFSKPGKIEWVNFESSEFSKIRNEINLMCGPNGPPNECTPQ